MQGDLSSGAKNPSQRLANAVAEVKTVQPAAAAPAPKEAPAPVVNESSAPQHEPKLKESPFWKNISDDEGESADLPAETGDSSSPNPNVEKIKAGGRTIEVDFSDREAIKKKIELAEGARKWQTERDKAIKRAEAAEKRAAEQARKAEAFAALEEVADNPKELVRRLTGGKLDWDSLIERESEKRQLLKDASPEEREAMLKAEKDAETLRRAQQERQALEERLKKLDTEKEEATKARVKSMYEDAFGKVEFSGKIDDPVKAEALNEQLWDTTNARIKRLIRQHNEKNPDNQVTPEKLSPEFIRKQFAKTAKIMSEAIDLKVKETVQKSTTKKREAAKENAQLASTRNYSEPNYDDLRKFAGRPTELFKQLTRRK
jgi:hypothetical protein